MQSNYKILQESQNLSFKGNFQSVIFFLVCPVSLISLLSPLSLLFLVYLLFPCSKSGQHCEIWLVSRSHVHCRVDQYK